MLVCVKCNWWRWIFFPLRQTGVWSVFSRYGEADVSIGVWQTLETFSPKKFPWACCCLLSATWAAITRCLSTTSKQQGQRQSFHAHDLLWPFSPEITPWFLHLAHFGLLKRCSIPEFTWVELPLSVFILNRCDTPYREYIFFKISTNNYYFLFLSHKIYSWNIIRIIVGIIRCAVYVDTAFHIYKEIQEVSNNHYVYGLSILQHDRFVNKCDEVKY